MLGGSASNLKWQVAGLRAIVLTRQDDGVWQVASLHAIVLVHQDDGVWQVAGSGLQAEREKASRLQNEVTGLTFLDMSSSDRRT